MKLSWKLICTCSLMCLLAACNLPFSKGPGQVDSKAVSLPNVASTPLPATAAPAATAEPVASPTPSAVVTEAAPTLAVTAVAPTAQPVVVTATQPPPAAAAIPAAPAAADALITVVPIPLDANGAALPPPPPPGPPNPAAATRINFAPGATSAAWRVELSPGMPKTFVFGALANQQASIFASGNLTVALYDPQGRALAPLYGAATPWSYRLPTNGDYLFWLYGGGAYNVTLEIVGQTYPSPAPPTTKRIAFAPGATSASWSVYLNPGVAQSFIFGARGGQHAALLTNGALSDFILYDPRGIPLQALASAPGWQYILTRNGDYILTLYGSGQINLTLSIDAVNPPVPPGPVTRKRISFRPGNASATFSTQLVSGQAQDYVLRVMAGQTIFVSASGNANVAMFGPGDAPLPTYYDAAYGRWQAPAAQTGDYVIRLSGSGPSTVTVYIPPR